MQRVKKGFTLLEILLVIAVIGILAAIVLVAINPNRQINQARKAGINSEKNQLEKAIQQRLIDTGSYPTVIDGVQRKICSNTVATDCINLATDLANYIVSIPTGATYTVAKGNDGRVYVNPTETVGTLSCPTGYIKVPGNSLYQTKDFCVMKYEAKTSSPAATTAAAGTPVVTINQEPARTACTNNNTGGVTGYGLITNAEWMTIARNIEGQLSNWTTGTAASSAIPTGLDPLDTSGLYRGHSDGYTDLGESTALAAGADNNGYIGTGQSGFSIERRTHTLSNGEVIWDLSGNVWEWTNDIIMGVDKPTGGAQFTDMTGYGSLSYDLTRPSNSTWNITQNMGQYSAGSTTGEPFAFIRGGNWYSSTDAGVFTLALNNSPSSLPSTTFGFRCVLR
jgi:prepilin-type N-terminal cleavage/methylation domain-containing protein